MLSWHDVVGDGCNNACDKDGDTRRALCGTCDVYDPSTMDSVNGALDAQTEGADSCSASTSKRSEVSKHANFPSQKYSTSNGSPNVSIFFATLTIDTLEKVTKKPSGMT